MKLTKQLSLLFLGVSIGFGFIAMIIFSYPVTFFLFILFGNVLGWYYTAKPLQLNYHDLGEIGTMLTVGVIIPGLGYFVIADQINTFYVPLLIPMLFQGFAFSFYLEIPDKEADFQAKKKTLVVRQGVLFGFIVGILSSLCATLSFFLFGFFHITSGNLNYWLVALFSLIPLFLCVHSLVRYHADTRIVNPLVFRSTASFIIFFLLLIGYFIYVILI